MFKKKLCLMFIFSSLLFSSSYSQGATLIKSREFRDFFKTPYGMGLGGAVIAQVSNASALFYNPAGLANIDGFDVSFNLGVEISSKTVDFAEDLIDAADSSQASVIVDKLLKYRGDAFRGRIYLYTGVSFAGFAAYVTVNAASVESSNHPNILKGLAIENISEAALNVGYAKNFFKDRLKLGFTGRVIYRMSLDKDVSIIDLQGDTSALRIEDIVSEGFGIDFDFGMQLHFDSMKLIFFKAKPKIGASVHNIIESDFKNGLDLLGDKGTTIPLERYVNFGISLEFGKLGFVTPELSASLNHLGLEHGDFTKHLNFGLEFRGEFFSFLSGATRIHLNALEFGGGIFLKFGFLTVDILTYAAQIGEETGNIVDRRYVGQVGFKF